MRGHFPRRLVGWTLLALLTVGTAARADDRDDRPPAPGSAEEQRDLERMQREIAAMRKDRAPPPPRARLGRGEITGGVIIGVVGIAPTVGALMLLPQASGCHGDNVLPSCRLLQWSDAFLAIIAAAHQIAALALITGGVQDLTRRVPSIVLAPTVSPTNRATGLAASLALRF